MREGLLLSDEQRRSPRTTGFLLRQKSNDERSQHLFQRQPNFGREDNIGLLRGHRPGSHRLESLLERQGRYIAFAPVELRDETSTFKPRRNGAR